MNEGTDAFVGGTDGSQIGGVLGGGGRHLESIRALDASGGRVYCAAWMTAPARVSIPVLHDADGVVVVDKPAGLETTGRTPDDPGGVQHHLQRQLGRRLWAVHQLDRDTSGVLVFVRRRPLVAAWQARLARRDTHKIYRAIVHGPPSFEHRAVDVPLCYDEGARRWVVDPGAGSPSSKPASSEVTVLARADRHALVEVVLHTGRTHQARVHLAHLGHPVVGERRHRMPPCTEHPRQALHAWRLEIDTCDETFEAPLPDDLLRLLDRLGLSTSS